MMNIYAFKDYVRNGRDFNISLSERFSKNNKKFTYSKEGLTLKVEIAKDRYEYVFKKFLSKVCGLKNTCTLEQYFPNIKSLSDDIVDEFIEGIESDIFELIHCNGKIWKCVRKTKLPTTPQAC